MNRIVVLLSLLLISAGCDREFAGATRAPLGATPLSLAAKGPLGNLGPVDVAFNSADRDVDETDNSINGIIGRLGSVGNVSAVVGGRLDAINAVLGVPPDDNKPTLQAKVDVIRANLNAALGTLALIQDKLGPR